MIFFCFNIKIGFLHALLFGIRYPDEPLRRNCSRLVPDSQNNFVTILLYSVLSTFCTCSLAAIYCVFSFDQSIANLLIFFNWCDKVGLFFFFQYIYFFP